MAKIEGKSKITSETDDHCFRTSHELEAGNAADPFRYRLRDRQNILSVLGVARMSHRHQGGPALRDQPARSTASNLQAI